MVLTLKKRVTGMVGWVANHYLLNNNFHLGSNAHWRGMSHWFWNPKIPATPHTLRPMFDQSTESYQTVLSCGIVYYAVQGKKGLTFKSVDENLVRNYSHKSLSISTLGPNLLKLLSILSMFFNSCSWMLVVTYWISRTNKSGLMHKRYQLHSSHSRFFSVKFK